MCLQVGTASILNGLSFQLATSTSATLTPSTATWGDVVLLEIISDSLNPSLGNLTGNYTAYVVGGDIPADTIVNVTGGEHIFLLYLSCQMFGGLQYACTGPSYTRLNETLTRHLISYPADPALPKLQECA